MSTRNNLRRIAGAAALLALFTFYIAMRPLGVHVSDSYAWVNTIEQEAYGYFFHPHHLLYLPLAWRWNQLAHVLLPGAPVWGALAGMSAAFGCAGAAALYLSLRLLGARAAGAAAGTALAAFSFGYWFFSSDAEVYTVSASCALWAVYWLTRYSTQGTLSPALWAGAAAGFAALFHQTGIFLFVPAGLVFAAFRRQRGMAAPMSLFAAAFGALVVPTYLAAAWAALPALGAAPFVRWILLFGAEGYGGWGAARTCGAPLGLVRGIVGGQMVLDWLRGAAGGGPWLWLGAALALAGLAAVGVLAMAAIARIREAAFEAKVMAAAAAGGFATYAVFGTYFDPANFEWWTIPVALLVTSIAVLALTGRRAAIAVALAAAILVASANFALDFSYRRRPDCDLVRNAARRLAAMTTDEDVIVVPSYLGVLVWREAPHRRIICPDEDKRKPGEADPARRLEAMFDERGQGAGRVVIAGCEGERKSRSFANMILRRVPTDDRQVIGSILFFTSAKGPVRKVGQVPVLAVGRRSRVVASGAQAF